jgi:hypothetical protein
MRVISAPSWVSQLGQVPDEVPAEVVLGQQVQLGQRDQFRDALDLGGHVRRVGEPGLHQHDRQP